MDGTYVHPAPRKANKKSERLDYRLKKNQNPNKRYVMVTCEYFSTDEKAENKLNLGIKRSQVFVTYSKSRSVVKKFIQKNSRINTDESNTYDSLLVNYNLRTVNHKDEYRSHSRITNNQAESFFSCFKRMYYGHVHKMSNTSIYSTT